MPYLLLLLLFAVPLWFWWQHRKAAPLQKRRYFYRALLISAASALVILVLTGRLHWVGVMFAALLPLLRPMLALALRNIPLLEKLYKSFFLNRTQSANYSTVSARFIEMRLDQTSGTLDGQIVDGPHSGAMLAQLERDQLEELLSYYRQRDNDSERLLHSYLQSRYGEDFEPQGTQQQTNASSGEFNESEALAILGLEPDASREDVVQAHKRLMQKLHPDRGGNDYLATQLNAARDLLLSRL